MEKNSTNMKEQEKIRMSSLSHIENPNINNNLFYSNNQNNTSHLNLSNFTPNQIGHCRVEDIYSDNQEGTPRTNNIFTMNGNVLSERKNIFLEPKCEVEEKVFCEVCFEEVIKGEIVYYCLCSNFYHPSCLIQLLAKQNRNINKNCEECKAYYKVASYEVNMTSTYEKTNSTIDTNINNLDNYNEMCGMAFHLSSEGIVEMINKKNDNNNHSFISTDGIGRIALSPIHLNSTTPYSGKTKQSLSSNQNVEDYIRLQNTHTTPHNFKHINTIHARGYDNSPDLSFQGVRQHLSFYSPNGGLERQYPHVNDENINNINRPHINNENLEVNNTHPRYFTTSHINKHKPIINDMDIDKFFKSVNLDIFDTNNISNSNLNVKTDFRKLIFEDEESNDRDNTEDHSGDKENSPPIPRESSKYSYFDPNVDSCPLEINLEAGISHIVSNSNKVVEVPITIEVKLKDNNMINYSYSKDYILIFNTRSLNVEAIFQILKIAYEKLTENDRIFTNIFKIDKLLTKDELREILSLNFETHLQDTSYLNHSEIMKLINYCIDLSLEYHSNIFTMFLICDLDEIPQDVNYLEEMKTVSDKMKETKVNLLKNFTINCVVLDKLDEEKNLQTVKGISFFYELSMLCMGYFMSPKDFNELYKSVYVLFGLYEQVSLLNLKANIQGNKDPSVYLEVMNYPYVKTQHNQFDLHLGSLMRKERKFINFNAIIILNNHNVALNLPLIEINLEYLSLKNKDINTSFLSFNSTSGQNLIKTKTTSYQITIPIITQNKEVLTSSRIYLRYCCSKVADNISQCIELLKYSRFEEAVSKLYESRAFYEQILNNIGFSKYFKAFSSSFHNDSNSKFISNSNDDSLFEIIKNMNNINLSKMFNFSMLILLDINHLIEKLKNKSYNSIADFYTIKQSLMFYRPVHLSDDRFLDDMLN